MTSEPVTPAAQSGPHCCLCGAATKGFLEVVSTCAEHCRYGLVEERMSEIRTVLARWLKASDAYSAVSNDAITNEAAEFVAATDALERVARRCMG